MSTAISLRFGQNDIGLDVFKNIFLKFQNILKEYLQYFIDFLFGFSNNTRTTFESSTITTTEASKLNGIVSKN